MKLLFRRWVAEAHICDIVDSQDGGMKLPELLEELVKHPAKTWFESLVRKGHLRDYVVNTATKSKYLGALHYILDVGDGSSCEQVFIYRRIASKPRARHE